MVLLLYNRAIMPVRTAVYCIVVICKLMYKVFWERAEKQQYAQQNSTDNM